MLFRSYTKAAEQGYAQAQYNMGVLSATGRGVTQSDVEATRWYSMAADQGYEMARENMQVLLDTGRGQE